MNAAAEPTPRATRLRLNRMERWYRRAEAQDPERFRPEDRVFFRSAFEYAQKAEHAEVIAEALREYVRPSESPIAPAGVPASPDTP